MRKYLLIFLALFIINIIGIDNIDAAKVSSNGDFTIRGEKYNINTTTVHTSGIKIKEVQMYQDKIVSEICQYTESDEDDPRDIKYLFIYSDGSASVGWVGENVNLKYGDNENDHDGYESIIFNWKGGNTASKWDRNNGSLTDDYDAYKAHKKGTCPYYLVLNNNYWHNYIYISTEEGYNNLNALESIAQTPQGEKKGTVHTFYLVGDLDTTRSGLSCNYKYEDKDIFTLNFDNYGTPTIKLLTNNSDGMANYVKAGEYIIEDYNLTSNFKSNKYWSYIEKGKCPSTIQTCLKYSNNQHVTTYNMNIYGDDSTLANVQCDVRIGLNCTGDNCSTLNECGKFTDFFNALKDKIGIYKNCKSSSCKKEALNDYNFEKDSITSFCKSVLQNLNYSEGGCVSACLNLSKEIEDLEVGVLKTGYSETKCNIGESVLHMVYNVLKWAKYIAPILVIILSILDFIKAIAAQNDDDMKKAQGKFVKRLMVAALLFLLPLIINFMLKTFGLYSSECDISDLFS